MDKCAAADGGLMYNTDDALDTGIITSDASSDSDADDPYDVPDTRSPEAVAGIEGMVISFLDQLASNGRVSDAQSDRGSSDEASYEGSRTIQGKGRLELRLRDRSKDNTSLQAETPCKTLKYPRKNSGGSLRPFAQLFRILDLSHEAIINEMPTTKRDVYYKDVPLFKNQRVVDGLVDDLAATLELQRSDLKIRASPKGLICGSGLSVHLTSGEAIQITDTEGTIIPIGEDVHTFSLDEDVQWVLIVEKEAVFQTLCRLRITDHHAIPGRGLMITGKGFPDVATRHLVATLADALPSSVPIFALVDADPYGLEILSVYKFGSRSLRHENDSLMAPRVRWLGLKTADLASFGIDRDGLIPITRYDEKKALSLLRDQSALPLKWRRELMRILHTRRKAEIEILTNMPGSATSQFEHSSERAERRIPLPSRPTDIGSALGIGDPGGKPMDTEEIVKCVDIPLLRYLSRRMDESVKSAKRRANGQVIAKAAPMSGCSPPPCAPCSWS